MDACGQRTSHEKTIHAFFSSNILWINKFVNYGEEKVTQAVITNQHCLHNSFIGMVKMYFDCKS